MARKASLSGFPEWLPEERAIEKYFMNKLSEVFTLHGFSEIETRVVEPISVIAQKGEIDKEIYMVSRYQEQGSSKKDPLALHFDLTVPFARYVKDNAPFLNFPFKRYQMQKVWRGERPQDGRQREFTQVDIDIVNEETLPLTADAQLLKTIITALESLPLPGFVMRLNNRKISEGFYQGLGIEDTAKVLQLIDKLDKIGAEKVKNLLTEAGIVEDQANKALALAEIREKSARTAIKKAQELGVESELFDTGCQELSELIELIDSDKIEVDFSIARGLDYYTGTVYETELIGHKDLGSICSGGRYDSLVNTSKKTYPGVGISIGLSRLLSRLIGKELVKMSRKHPAVVYVALNSEAEHSKVAEVANKLRVRGIASEEGSKPVKFGKQIKTADELGIPFVCFLQDDDSYQIKDIRSGDQEEIDLNSWEPPKTDLQPTIITNFG
ncbi:MAG: histidine--tRNA ligase [Micrococcaceae bacterium]